jgi:hypothetical protein
VDHEHRNPSVVVDVCADAAEQVGGDPSASARTHDEQVVIASVDLLDYLLAGMPVLQDRGDGEVLGDGVDRFA